MPIKKLVFRNYMFGGGEEINHTKMLKKVLDELTAGGLQLNTLRKDSADELNMSFYCGTCVNHSSQSWPEMKHLHCLNSTAKINENVFKNT